MCPLVKIQFDQWMDSYIYPLISAALEKQSVIQKISTGRNVGYQLTVFKPCLSLHYFAIHSTRILIRGSPSSYSIDCWLSTFTFLGNFTFNVTLLRKSLWPLHELRKREAIEKNSNTRGPHLCRKWVEKGKTHLTSIHSTLALLLSFWVTETIKMEI